tara:strand:+ start:68 stop:244 length:177 start_codon:yes stop_codon:yes gene_type:complete
MDGISHQESTGMNITTDKNVRTAVAVAVWVTLLALSQEAAAIDGCARIDSSVVMTGRQ